MRFITFMAILALYGAAFSSSAVADDHGQRQGQQYQQNYEQQDPEFGQQEGDPESAIWGWTCYARNARGMNFVGRAFWRYRAEQEALNRCYRISRFCNIVGCQRG